MSLRTLFYDDINKATITCSVASYHATYTTFTIALPDREPCQTNRQHLQEQRELHRRHQGPEREVVLRYCLYKSSYILLQNAGFM